MPTLQSSSDRECEPIRVLVLMGFRVTWSAKGDQDTWKGPHGLSVLRWRSSDHHHHHPRPLHHLPAQPSCAVPNQHSKPGESPGH